MNYYGNKDMKRVAYVAMYEADKLQDKGNAIGFINDMDKLFEYSIEHFRNSKMLMHRHGKTFMATESEHPFVTYTDRWMGLKKKKFEGNKYYSGYMDHNGDNTFVIMMELPRIADDDVFQWKHNNKYGIREFNLSQGLFEYQIIVKADGNACIDVSYKKCDNKHRTKVTISQIHVYNASNQDILDAIKEWKRTFAEELEGAA